MQAVGGICALIKATPLNFALAIHIRSVLGLYFSIMPVAILSSGMSPFIMVVLIFILLWVALTVDEIACEMETPFGNEAVDLPMGNYCQLIITGIQMFKKTPALSFCE